MKDCSSCKNSPLNSLKFIGKDFEKTPCYLCVLEDQRMNRPDKNFIEFDEELHARFLPVSDMSFYDEVVSRVERLRILRKDLLHSRKISIRDDQILEMLSEDPTPSFREIARRLKTTHWAISKKVAKLRRLLSAIYA